MTGRRVGKQIDGVVTRFLHAGDMEIAEYDGSGTLLRRYIPGGAIDARVAYIEGAGTDPADIRYYHADRLGNVAALTDDAGEVVDRYAYDPFGNEVTGAPTSGQLFRYTGRKFDPETGLYYYRARYYDPALGRFLQTDPVGYNDQYNLYVSFQCPAYQATLIKVRIISWDASYIVPTLTSQFLTLIQVFHNPHNVAPFVVQNVVQNREKLRARVTFRAVNCIISMTCTPWIGVNWCGREDSNLHGLLHSDLNAARLPVPPRPHA